MHLEKTTKGDDNLCLVFKKYSMDFRDYLRLHRDPLILPLILQQIVEGLIQLHSLGYVHRDLKPENILLNLDPLEVRINDFSTSIPRTQKFTGTIRGSPGYVPIKALWNDGSLAWDLYTLGVIIIESAMPKDWIFKIKSPNQLLRSMIDLITKDDHSP